MLDMGFLPDIKRVLRHLPAKRQTLFFSATMPAPDRRALAARCCTHPVTINLDRQAAPAGGDHPGRLPGRREAEAGAPPRAPARGAT